MESTATTAVKGTEFALLTARIMDAVALTCAQDNTCSCKETYQYYIVKIVITREIGWARLARSKSSQFYKAS